MIGANVLFGAATSAPKPFRFLQNVPRSQSKKNKQNELMSQLEQQATITDVTRLGEEWRVYYQGTFWKARCLQSPIELQLDDRVQVVGRHNLTLWIQPILKDVSAPRKFN